MANSVGKSTTPDNKALRGLGVLGLLGIGGSHLEYWLGPLKGIPTIIGPLFEFTFIFAFVLALVMVVFPRALIAVLAAGFAFATLGGYLLSLLLPMGIFLYKDPGISYAGGVAIASEVIGGLALLVWGGTRLLSGRGATTSSVPFGATAGDTASATKPAKAPKPAKASRKTKESVPFGAIPGDTASATKPAKAPKPAKASRKTKESVPFGATAEDRPTVATPVVSVPRIADKPDRTKTRRNSGSVQSAIEEAQAAFQSGNPPSSGWR